MKRNARKNASQERQSRIRTRGGPPSPPVQPETEWFRSVMPISMDGLPSVVDDDLIETTDLPTVSIFNNSQKVMDLDQSVKISIANENKVLSPSKNIICTVSDMNKLNENVFDSKSPAALLRTPVSKPLRIRKRSHSINKSFHELKSDILQKTRECEEHIYQLKVKHMEEKRKEEREIYELKKKKLILEINVLENKLQN